MAARAVAATCAKAAGSRIASSARDLRSSAIPASFIPCISWEYEIPCCRVAALMRVIASDLACRFLSFRCFVAYVIAWMTDSFATRYRVLRAARWPLAACSTALCLRRRVFPVFTLGISKFPVWLAVAAELRSYLDDPLSACRIFFEARAESSGSFAPNNLLNRFGFRRRRWLLGPFDRNTAPLAERWKRFFAPLCVFIFGIYSIMQYRRDDDAAATLLLRREPEILGQCQRTAPCRFR